MDSSVLLCIKTSVQQFAQVISTVLEMDVDIVDENLIRVAGTNRFLRNINQPIDNQGNAFKKVLQTKKMLVVENPGKDEVCFSCISKEVCTEKFEICCPILLDRNVIGVISLAVFDESKRVVIIEKLKSYTEFLEQISSLIAAKAAEYRNFQQQAFSLELLKNLLDRISEGVIVFDQNQHILHINMKCEQILGNKMEQLVYMNKIKQFAIQKQKNSGSGEVEYVARVKTRKIRLIGRNYPILVDHTEVGTVFVFQDVTALQKSFLQMYGPEKYSFEHIVGNDPEFLKVKEKARLLAVSEEDLLVWGETGIGKEVFARAIHNESPRREGPFVTVICSGTLEDVLEKEIFGSGTESTGGDYLGKIRLAHGGTLFMDDIGDLPPRLQSRLMKASQDKKKVDVRLIATSSMDLRDKVESGEFRKDLYYSLITFSIHIPPVRSRPEDIMLLVAYFLERYCSLEGKEVRLGEDVLKILKQYSWPGNVREIERIVSFIVSTQAGGTIVSVESLPAAVRNQLVESRTGRFNLEQMEKNAILEVLNTFGSTTDAKKRAAVELGISTATLYRKLQRHGILETKQYK